MRRILLTAVCFWLVSILSTADGQESGGPKTAPVRMIYAANHQAADDLTALLTNQFATEGGLRFSQLSSGNLIAITAVDEPLLDRVVNFLQEADRPKARMTIQATVVELSLPKDGEQPAVIDDAAFSGSAAEVVETARTWVRNGSASRVQSFSISGLDNQIAEMTTGEIVPKLTSRTVTARGTVPGYSDRSFGVTFSAIPRLTKDNSVLCELIFNLSEPDAAKPAAEGEDAALTQGVNQMRTQTTLSIPNGKSVVASTFDVDGASAPRRTLLVISATVHGEPGAVTKAVNAAGPTGRPMGATPRGRFEAGGVDASAMRRERRPPGLLGTAGGPAMRGRLKLTEEQVQAIEKMQQELREMVSSDAFRQLPAEERQQGFEEFSKKRAAAEAEAMKLLTDDQRAVWEEYVKQAQPARGP